MTLTTETALYCLALQRDNAISGARLSFPLISLTAKELGKVAAAAEDANVVIADRVENKMTIWG